ncbi:MAG: hypothetical protein DESF_00200 [Desulfovibrio sp.]
MVVHQNITNLAGYFHFLNVRKIPYVIFGGGLVKAVCSCGSGPEPRGTKKAAWRLRTSRPRRLNN